MDNPETLATLGVQDTGQINVRENRRGNQEWTIQRHWQHWVYKTQDKDKPSKNRNTGNYKDEQRRPHQNPLGGRGGGGGGVVIKKD
jgi:hypothetical protein